MVLKPNIAEVIDRYRAFWRRDKLDRIPIRIRVPAGNLQAHESYLARTAAPADAATWEEVALIPDRYLAYWERQLEAARDIEDDSIPTAPLDLGPALMAGVMGAPILFQHGTSWTEHPLTDWRDAGRYAYDPQNPWLARVLGMARYFLDRSAGRFAVGLPNLMGPADILTALRGPTALCMDVYDNPGELEDLLGRCTEGHLRTAEALLALLPGCDGGTCEPYMYWTEGRGYCLTCDVSSVLSPQIYGELFLAFDQALADSLQTPWMHVHSGAAFMTEEFLRIGGLRGVQIVNDAPAGPSLRDLVPLLRRIQQRHCLILRKYGIGEVLDVLPELSPAGLLVDTQCGSAEEARRALADWNRVTAGL